MLTIHISDRIVGKTILYQHTKQRGDATLVSLYEATASIRNAETFHFHVTRDSSRRVFGPIPEKLYGTYCECPPNKPDKPYQAVPVTHTGTKTFALRLGEYDHHRCDTLQGVGHILRTHIMIHIGPGCSLGCFMISGEIAHQQFTNFMKAYLSTGQTEIRVYVDARHPDGNS